MSRVRCLKLCGCEPPDSFEKKTYNIRELYTISLKQKVASRFCQIQILPAILEVLVNYSRANSVRVKIYSRYSKLQVLMEKLQVGKLGNSKKEL